MIAVLGGSGTTLNHLGEVSSCSCLLMEMGSDQATGSNQAGFDQATVSDQVCWTSNCGISSSAHCWLNLELCEALNPSYGEPLDL